VTCPEHEGAAIVYSALQRKGRVEATISSNWNTECMYHKLTTAETTDDAEGEIQPGIWILNLSDASQSDAQLFVTMQKFMCRNRLVYEIDVSDGLSGQPLRKHLLIYATSSQNRQHYMKARLVDVRALETRVRNTMKE
jgi:hypothetical protein